jgi:hypothetical protein
MVALDVAVEAVGNWAAQPKEQYPWPEWQLFMDVFILAFAAFIFLAGVCEVYWNVKSWIEKRKKK